MAGDQMIIGRMALHTSLPGVLQCCGGGLDNNAVNADGSVSIDRTMYAELREEVGLDVHNKKQVTTCTPMFLSFGDDGVGKVLGYIVSLPVTTQEFLAQYNQFAASLRAKNEQPEFAELVSLSANPTAVEQFIATHPAQLNPYMPALMRAVAGYTAAS